jgi:amino acid adenylation domain-containing protein
MIARNQEPDHLPPPPDLPTVAPARLPASAGRLEHWLRPDQWTRLTERARAAGGEPEALLLAAFAEVLRTWSKSPDFTLAYRIAGGPTKPIAMLRSDDPFAATVSEFRRRIANAVDQPAPAPPALPVVVTVLASAGADPQPIGETLLDFSFCENADGLRIRWDFAAVAFPPGLVDAAFDALRALLDRLTADDAAWTLRRLDLVPDAQRALVEDVNATAAPVPNVLLHELLAARVEAQPQAEAVVDSRRRLRYEELYRYANRIGRRLRQAGVQRRELVAIVMEKGWEQYAAVYGVLTAGAAYVPIDASAPAERLARLLDRGGVRHVLTQSWLTRRLRWPASVTLHAVDEEFETGAADPLPPVQQPTDLAYVIFTSGSTGEPKGVMVDHRGVVNLVCEVNKRFGVGPTDRAFAISALHFDASIYDVFGVPAAGGTVVLPDPFERAQPDRWTDWVKAEAVTLWNSVPAIMELVVGQAEIRADRPLASLRLAVLSGDWIPLTLPDRLRAQADQIAVVGSGGPTETICWSLFYPIGTVDPAWKSIPYGRPIANQRYHIVDDELRERPLWVPGQMAVASDIGLAHGYFADEARTAAQFVRLPGTGERAYLTGDLGRWLPDGNIEILGREDFQVKIQGYRIELGEIEAALREHSAVESAVVVAPETGRGGKRLHGFVVARGAADPDELRTGLQAVLPAYMVPTKLEVLDAMPLTGNGKVDRLALIARASGRSGSPPAADPADQVDAVNDIDEPVSALERVVCQAMADVLGIEQRVGRTANFLRLGGDSISGARLGQQLRDLLGVKVPLRVVFENPVASALADAIANDPVNGAEAVEVATLLEAFGGEAADLLEADARP